MIEPLELKRRKIAVTCGGGRTQQHQKDEADINQILRRFQRTGLVNHLAKGTPQYGDFSNVTDYQTAVAQVEAAHEAFMALPSNIRREFNNDPGELVRFMDDEGNLDRARELGLVPKKATAPQPVAQSEPGPEEPGVTQTS